MVEHVGDMAQLLHAQVPARLPDGVEDVPPVNDVAVDLIGQHPAMPNRNTRTSAPPEAEHPGGDNGKYYDVIDEFFFAEPGDLAFLGDDRRRLST